MMASMGGHVEFARVLIEAKADVNAANEVACMGGDAEAARVLIAAKADAHAVSTLRILQDLPRDEGGRAGGGQRAEQQSAGTDKRVHEIGRGREGMQGNGGCVRACWLCRGWLRGMRGGAGSSRMRVQNEETEGTALEVAERGAHEEVAALLREAAQQQRGRRQEERG